MENKCLRILRIYLFASSIAIVSCLFGCKLHRTDLSDKGTIEKASLFYETHDDEESDVDWLEYMPVFHFWEDIETSAFLFGEPSDKQVEKWKYLCEERNPTDSVMRSFVQGSFHDMNQYMTVHDFVELWYHEDSYSKDDSLTLWRLWQYNAHYSRNIYSTDSEYDRFAQLKDIIQSLCFFDAGSQWELNFKSSLECDFQEFYDRLLLEEAVRHSSHDLQAALLDEEEAWKNYHFSLDSAFRIIDGDPHGMVGSAWTMAICGILKDDADTRAASLEDFYFALTDSLDYGPAGNHRKSRIGEYAIERHKRFTEGQVIREYHRFMEFFKNPEHFDPEFSYSASVLRATLEKEMTAWKAWITARKRVASLLTGICREVYDNSTNNVLRRKIIMLKNRYQGYGLTSEFVMECLLNYTCPDSEIDTFSFERNWKENL